MHRFPYAGLSVFLVGLMADPDLLVGSELACWELTHGLRSFVISGYQQNYE